MVSALFTALAIIAAGQAEPAAAENDSASNFRGVRTDVSWRSPRVHPLRSKGPRRQDDG